MVEGVPLFCGKGECNCVDESIKLKMAESLCMDLYWICPAHGYKRL